MKQHRAGNGQRGVGFVGDACAVKAPAFLCAWFGFEGDMGGVGVSKWQRLLGAGQRCLGAVWASGLAGGAWGEGNGGDLLAGTLRGLRQPWEGARWRALRPEDAT